MKVYTNKYRYHWISPYKICEVLCFWREIDYDEPWVKRTSDILTPVCTALMKFLDIVHPKVDYVKIDYWDTWNMDSTLSHIILPMLKQLKEKQHGAGFVDDRDVPKHLRSTAAKPKENKWDTDEFHFDRWNWVLDEMIWAFEQVCDKDWESKFFSGESDIQWEKNEDGTRTITRGPKDTHKFDKKGWQKHYKRIQNGTTLFGKYYSNLWD
jgi:hypothetical protein